MSTKFKPFSRILKMFISFILVLAYIFSFQTVKAVNLKFKVNFDDNVLRWRTYANAYNKTEAQYKKDCKDRNLQIGSWIKLSTPNNPVYINRKKESYLPSSYTTFAVRFDHIDTINTSYGYSKNSSLFYDVLKDPDTALTLTPDINEYKFTGVPVSIDYFAGDSPRYAPYSKESADNGTARTALFITEKIKILQYIVDNGKVIFDYEMNNVDNQLSNFKELLINAGPNTYKGKDTELRMSEIGKTDYIGGSNTTYKDNMDTGWKFMPVVNGFGCDNQGSIKGSNCNGKYRSGTSGLNAYDNIVKIPFANKRSVYVRSADISNNWKSIPNAANPSQAVAPYTDNDFIENEFADFSSNNSEADVLARNAGFQEKYTINSTTALRVANDVKGNFDSATKILTIGNDQYEYVGLYNYWGNTMQECLADTNPFIKYFELKTDFYMDPIDQTDYAAFTFAYKKIKNSNSAPEKEVYVNHIDAGTMTTIQGLASGKQTLNQSDTDNQIAIKPNLSAGLVYLEYYRYNKNDNMVIKKSSLLKDNKVTINGKTYEYSHLRTATAYNLDIADDVGRNLSTDIYADSISLIGEKQDTTTIVSFYYKEVDSGNPGTPGDPPSWKPDIKGRLAFKTIYDQNCADNGGIEYIPTNQDLKPYIEGAQKYIIPYVNEADAQKITYPAEPENVGYKYDTYFEINVEGIKKGGVNKTGKKAEYHNNFQTYKLTGTTPKEWDQDVKPLNANYADMRIQPYPSNATFEASGGGLNIDGKPLSIDLSKIDSTINQVTNSYTGTELGYVKFYHDYTYTGDEMSECGPDAKDCKPTKTGEYYTEEIYRFDPDTDEKTWYSKSTLRGNSTPSDGFEYRKETVNVTYKVSLKKRYKLNHLQIYTIVSDGSDVSGISANDRCSVFEAANTNFFTSSYYMDTIRNKLKTYYQDYYTVERTIPTCNNDLTTDKDYATSYKVPADRYNGVRVATSNIVYELYDIATENVVSDGTKLSLKIERKYNDTISRTATQNERINIFTPIALANPTIESVEVVNHDENSNSNSNTSVIQKNAKFTLTPKTTNSQYYKEIDTLDYLKEYYVKFEFDVAELITSDNSNPRTLKKNTYVRVAKDGWVSGIATSGVIDDVVGQFSNKIRIIGVANNVSGLEFINRQLSNEQATGEYLTDYESGYNNTYLDQNQNKIRGSCDEKVNLEYNGYESASLGMKRDARYMVFFDYNTYNIGRIYDFKVTDCSDVNFKNVFRVYNDNTVNNLTGTYYYSGIRQLLLSESTTNILKNRGDIGTVPKKILPLGPYKNTDTRYIQAPKLGYRISFDLATTGYFKESEKENVENKYIIITPSYYYIKKNGTEFNNEIDLYYKNNQGQYTKFQGSNYNIKFKPNDGYRTIPNGLTTHYISYMSDKLKSLNIGSYDGFRLDKNMMSLSSTRFIQNWYGEFKLPNSIIAVEQGGNLNNRLTDGYIGVVFNIKAYENDGSKERILSYNTNNGNANPNTNTSQWDYEGFLGFNNPGNAVSKNDKLNIQLESGTWKIEDNDLYNKIKGTVVLYDLDNRAATDFE